MSDKYLLLDAVDRCQIAAVEETLKAGADINAKAAGQTSLHRAVEMYLYGKGTRASEACDELELIKLLLKYGADVYARDDFGQSPLSMSQVHPVAGYEVYKLLITSTESIGEGNHQNDDNI